MSWTDQFSNDPKLTTVIIILICFIAVAVLGCVCACICRTVPDVRNRVLGPREMNDPCVKCQLIDMGEMACYTGLCPGADVFRQV